MSECDCYDLEGFLKWVYAIDPTAIPGFMELFEPIRECIENGLDSFDEEKYSWRSYGSTLSEYISDDLQKKAEELIERHRNEDHQEVPSDPGQGDVPAVL